MRFVSVLAVLVVLGLFAFADVADAGCGGASSAGPMLPRLFPKLRAKLHHSSTDTASFSSSTRIRQSQTFRQPARLQGQTAVLVLQK